MAGGIHSVVDRLVAGWRGAPKITIVPACSDLPFDAPADAEGAVFKGEVLLVESALGPERAAKVLAHEAIGHIGVRRALGSGWAAFMADLAEGSRSDPVLRAARSHIERAYVDDAGACNLPALRVADEMTASLSEYLMDPQTGRMVVRQPLRAQALAMGAHAAREILLLDQPVSRTQMEGMLLIAERVLRRGGRFFGVPARLMGWYAGQMVTPKPRPIDNSRPPISLVESESLLRGAKDQADWRERFKALRDVLVLLTIPVLLVVGVASLFTNPVDFLKSIFR